MKVKGWSLILECHGIWNWQFGHTTTNSCRNIYPRIRNRNWM